MAAATAIKSRVRPATDSVSEPPAKRFRQSHNTPPSALSDLLLNRHQDGKKLGAAYGRILKDPKASNVDDSHTVIANGMIATPDASHREVIEISSEQESDDDSDEESDDEAYGNGYTGANGVSHRQSVEEDEIGGKENGVPNGYREPSIESGDGEPSFEDQLRAIVEPVDVEATLAQPINESTTLVRTSDSRSITAPTATSLGTVLTQALRTNDRQLLESCFDMHDMSSVRSTIERLPSNLVGDLLRRLAERIHKRPGRAGPLMFWVQWALIAHGGYLAGQADIVMRLESLVKIMKERASGLMPLLQLKGKLDMLSSQQQLRQNMQGAREKEEDEEAVIYVEGEEEDSLDEEAEMRIVLPTKSSMHSLDSRRARETEAAADVSEDDLPVVNGIDKDMDNASDASDAEEDLFDEDDESDEEEGEETSDSGVDDEQELDESEIDEIPDSDEEVLNQPPASSVPKSKRPRGL